MQGRLLRWRVFDWPCVLGMRRPLFLWKGLQNTVMHSRLWCQWALPTFLSLSAGEVHGWVTRRRSAD